MIIYLVDPEETFIVAVADVRRLFLGKSCQAVSEVGSKAESARPTWQCADDKFIGSRGNGRNALAADQVGQVGACDSDRVQNARVRELAFVAQLVYGGPANLQQLRNFRHCEQPLGVHDRSRLCCEG